MAKKADYNLQSASDAATCGIRHIGIGTSSSGKMREYLKKQGFDDCVIRAVVEDLIRRDYIDDERAGRKVLLVRSGKKQESRAYLRKRLFAAGVRSTVIDKLMTEVEEDGVLCFNLYLSVKPDVSDTEEAYASRDELMKLASKRGFTSEAARSAYGNWLEKVTDDKQK